VVTVLRPSAGEADCRWTWLPGEARTTRPGVPEAPADVEAYAKRYGAQHAGTLKIYSPNPPVRFEGAGPVRVAVQDLLAGGGYAVAWREASAEDGSRTLYVGTGNSYPARTAATDAAASVSRLAGRPLADVAAEHRAWWHAYYPQSFVTLPDARRESFYWIQMYKLACATRAGRTMMDTSGPWNVPTPWPYITWDLNAQLCYWPVVTSNRLDLGRSLIETLSRNRQALIGNVRPEAWQADSAYLPIATAQDLIGSRDGDMRYFKCVGDLPWALHDAWLLYRATMDDRLLREDIVPLLRRSVNLYLHLLEEGPDGRLHLPETYSPEYGTASDGNFDLALLRWACGALLESDRRLAIGDPLVPKWKDVLARLAPFPEDAAQGFLIGRGVPLARGHRHYSHLLMIYPLYLVNADQPGAAARIEASVRHWADRPEERMGYTFTGASSMMAAIGRGAEALTYLQGLDRFLEPNTLYIESSPTLETPLSAAQCLHDMFLQSWGDPSAAAASGPVIRVFPAVPPAWRDVRFHDLRADGAFLVSAERADGRTRWVRIRSLAGEPCRVRPGLEGDVAVLAARPIALKPLGAGTYELDLRKGEEAILYSGREAPAVRVAPLPRRPADRNPFGLRDARGEIK
jgi:alpha-L-fucosidase 2